VAELVICPKRSQTPAHWAVHRRTCRSAAATAAAVLSSATAMAVAIVNDATTAAVANYTPVPVVAAAAAAAAAAAPDQWRRRGQVEVNGGERHVATETIRRVATKATGVEYRVVEAAATRSVGIAEPSRDNVEQICHKGEDSHSREDCAYLSRE